MLPYSNAPRLSDPDPLTHIRERASSTRSWTAPRSDLIPTNCPQKLTSAPQTPGTTREAAAHGWNPPRLVNPSLDPTGPPEGRNPVQLGADNLGAPIRDQSMTEHAWKRADIDHRQTKLVYESLFFSSLPTNFWFREQIQNIHFTQIFFWWRYPYFILHWTEECEDSWLETNLVCGVEPVSQSRGGSATITTDAFTSYIFIFRYFPCGSFSVMLPCLWIHLSVLSSSVADG